MMNLAQTNFFLILILFLYSVNAAANFKAVESAYKEYVGPGTKKCKSQKECTSKQVCMNLPGSGSQCVKRPSRIDMTFQLPFPTSRSIVCTQSFGNLAGTHGWSSAFFALDLSTPWKEKPSEILASAPGTVYVSEGCPQPTGKPSKYTHDRCNNGWGNMIRIHHGNGIISSYSHLKEIAVKHGDRVKSGEVIGVEGGTGAAGNRHLHWDVQKIPGGKKVVEFVLSQKALNGVSVPYSFRVKVGGKTRTIWSDDVTCVWGDMSQQPWQPVTHSK